MTARPAAAETPSAAIVTVPPVAVKFACCDGSQGPVAVPLNQFAAAAVQVPAPPAAAPLPYQVRPALGAPGVYTRLRSLPARATLNVPAPIVLARPPVPLAAAALTVKASAAKPVMPVADEAIRQAPGRAGSKPLAKPLVCGSTADRLQRLIANGLCGVAAIASVPPAVSRSQPPAAPAVPAKSNTCQRSVPPPPKLTSPLVVSVPTTSPGETVAPAAKARDPTTLPLPATVCPAGTA